MKKTKLLSLTALALIGFLGLSSCGKGEKGDTGATGPAGETGPKGDKGDPGENGEDGKDGATWLTGTSKPADTLGNLGDMYLNTTNGDVYQKEESGWTLKMNIKGEDGEDGKDGANGSNGSTGPKGETAWSNTILPTENGYVVPSVGSAVEGEEVTFTLYPNEGYIASSLTLNGTEATLDGNTCTVEMVEGGFVVSAVFGKVVSNADNVTIESNDTLYPETSEVANTLLGKIGDDLTNVTIVYPDATDGTTVTISGTNKGENTNIQLGSGTYNIDGLKNENGSYNLYGSTTGETIVQTSKPVSGATIVENVTFEINIGGVSTQSISLLADSTETTLINNAFSINNGDSLTLNNVNVKGNYKNIISLDNKSKDAQAINLTINGGTYYSGTTKGIYLTNVGDLIINGATFDGTYNDPSTGVEVIDRSGSLIDINQCSTGGVVSITNSTFKNLTDSGETTGAIKLKVRNASELEYTDGSAPTDFGTNKPDGSFERVTITGNKFENNIRDIVLGTSQHKETASDEWVIQSDAKVYNFAKDENKAEIKENVFVNGQLYSEAYYENGVFNKSFSKPVEGVKFADGEGSEEKPLQIETAEQWNLLNNDLLKDKYYYFILNKDIDLNKGGAKITSIKAHIDLNNHSLTLLKSAWAITTFSGSIKNGSILNPDDLAKESFIYKNEGDILLEGITIGNPNKDTYVNVTKNTTIFVGNIYKDKDCDVIFRNCVNYVNYGIKNNGEGNYGGAFIGGWVHNLPSDSNNPVLFENCINYGDFKQQNGASFVGNSSEITDKTYKFVNCKNYGDITGTKSANVYVANTQGISDEEFIQKYKLNGIENFGNIVCGKDLSSYLTFSKNEEGKLEVTSTLGEDYQNVTYKVDLEVVFDWKNSSGVKIGQNRSHQVIKVNSLDEIDIYVANLDNSKVYTDSSIEETSKGYVKLVYDEDSKLYKAYVNNTSLDQVIEGSYIDLSDQEIKIFITVLDQNGNPVGFTSVKTLCEIN